MDNIALARKAMLVGFLWPTMKKDAYAGVKKCQSFQRHDNIQWKPE